MNLQTVAGNAMDRTIDNAHEYLTFTLGPEEYAIDILKVQEIRSFEQPTTIANAPAWLKGVTNLRGTIVPIIDMRSKFGIGTAEYTAFTVVIVLNVGDRIIGIVVDSVSDVLEMETGQIRPAPEFAAVVDTAYIKGLATINERMLIVMDIERLMLSTDMGLVDMQARSKQ